MESEQATRILQGEASSPARHGRRVSFGQQTQVPVHRHTAASWDILRRHARQVIAAREFAGALRPAIMADSQRSVSLRMMEQIACAQRQTRSLHPLPTQFEDASHEPNQQQSSASTRDQPDRPLTVGGIHPNLNMLLPRSDIGHQHAAPRQAGLSDVMEGDNAAGWMAVPLGSSLPPLLAPPNHVVTPHGTPLAPEQEPGTYDGSAFYFDPRHEMNDPAARTDATLAVLLSADVQRYHDDSGVPMLAQVSNGPSDPSTDNDGLRKRGGGGGYDSDGASDEDALLCAGQDGRTPSSIQFWNPTPEEVQRAMSNMLTAQTPRRGRTESAGRPKIPPLSFPQPLHGGLPPLNLSSGAGGGAADQPAVPGAVPRSADVQTHTEPRWSTVTHIPPVVGRSQPYEGKHSDQSPYTPTGTSVKLSRGGLPFTSRRTVSTAGRSSLQPVSGYRDWEADDMAAGWRFCWCCGRGSRVRPEDPNMQFRTLFTGEDSNKKHRTSGGTGVLDRIRSLCREGWSNVLWAMLGCLVAVVIVMIVARVLSSEALETNNDLYTVDAATTAFGEAQTLVSMRRW